MKWICSLPLVAVLAACAPLDRGVALTDKLDSIYDAARAGADVTAEVKALRDEVSARPWWETAGEAALGLLAVFLGVGGARRIPAAVRALRRVT